MRNYRIEFDQINIDLIEENNIRIWYHYIGKDEKINVESEVYQYIDIDIHNLEKKTEEGIKKYVNSILDFEYLKSSVDKKLDVFIIDNNIKI